MEEKTEEIEETGETEEIEKTEEKAQLWFIIKICGFCSDPSYYLETYLTIKIC